MNIKWINTPEQHNELFPLPEDYFELTEEGQRQARINACRLWMIPPARLETILRGVGWPDGPPPLTQLRRDLAWASHDFFSLYYLHPDHDADFDPMFFDLEPVRTPDFHRDLIGDWATHRMNLSICPRGSGKTYLVNAECIHKMVSCPKYTILYVSSSNKNTKTTSTRCREQVYDNARIRADWDREYGESLKPSRGGPPTGIENFKLSNMSGMDLSSIKSKLRGARPVRLKIDDAEYDPEAETSMVLMREYMHRLIFKVGFPMVSHPGRGMDIVGTLVSPAHYLYEAMQDQEVVEDGQTKKTAKIAAFKRFNRRLVRALQERDGVLVSAWPQVWPVDEAEKERLGLPEDTQTIPELRDAMGPAFFNSEMQGQPTSGDDTYFPLNPDPRGEQAYWYEEVDDLLGSDPKRSESKICWMQMVDGAWEKVSKPLWQFLKDARLFITCDTSLTASAHSDYKVSMVQALVGPDLFDLDLWWGQAEQHVQETKTLEMAKRWGVRHISPELINEGKAFERALKDKVYRSVDEDPELAKISVRGHVPSREEKQVKIAGAYYTRLLQGRRKLPWFMRQERMWGEYFDELEGFHPEIEGGGITHDDILDAGAMYQFVVPGHKRVLEEEAVKVDTVLEKLMKGERVDDRGVPLAYHVDWGRIDARLFDEVRDRMANSIAKGRSQI